MKIALVIRHYRPQGGGSERWTDGHARMLLERGHQVHLFAETIDDPPAGARCHGIALGPRDPRGKPFQFARQAAARLRRDRFDVVHDMGQGWYADVFMPHGGTRAAVYAQRTRLLAPPERWVRPLAYRILPRYLRSKALERRQYESSNGRLFIAVSEMIRRQMLRSYPIRDDAIRVVYNGVDLERFQPRRTEEDGAELRARLGFGDETVFLIVAHDFDLKGVDAILRALGSMRREGRRAGLIVVGPGTMRGKKFWGVPLARPCDRFPRLAHRAGCADAVRFVGFQSDPVPFYRAADVYVQPTLYDPCSLVVLEALACGLPVITSRDNGTSELIRSGVEGGILDDPLDVTDLARHMTRFLDPRRRRVAGIAARALAERHSRERNLEEILSVYREVATPCAREASLAVSSVSS